MCAHFLTHTATTFLAFAFLNGLPRFFHFAHKCLEVGRVFAYILCVLIHLVQTHDVKIDNCNEYRASVAGFALVRVL